MGYIHKVAEYMREETGKNFRLKNMTMMDGHLTLQFLSDDNNNRVMRISDVLLYLQLKKSAEDFRDRFRKRFKCRSKTLEPLVETTSEAVL